MRARGGYVYLVTNKRNTILYVGVTNDLCRRIYEHREGLVVGFTKKYNVKKLVYYEVADDIEIAISREKQIKAGSRRKKIGLIKAMNPAFRDLWFDII